MDKSYNNLKDYLHRKLQEREMSIEQFANAINVTRTMVYFYTQDRHRPSDDVAVRMSQVLGVPLEEIYQQYTPSRRGRPTKK